MWRTLDIWVFGVLFFLVNTVYVSSFPQGSLPKWEIIYALAFYCAFRGVGADLRVFAFVGFALVSLLWSDDAGVGALQVQKLVACVIVGLWIARSPVEERHITYAVAASFPVVAWLVVTGGYWGSFGNENFITEWIILCLPWMAYGIFEARTLFRRAWLWVGIRWTLLAFGLGAGAYLLAFNASRIEYVVAFLGCVVTLWLCKQRAWAVTLFCVGIGCALYGDFALDSIKARLEFWVNSGFVWLSAPLIGHGFGSFNFWYPRYDQVAVSLFPWIPPSMGPINFAGAAHNEYLQLLCELGTVGFILAMWVVWRPWKLSAASVCLGLLMIEGLIEFPMQNPATAFLGAVSFGLWLRSQSVSVATRNGARKTASSGWLRRLNRVTDRIAAT